MPSQQNKIWIWFIFIGLFPFCEMALNQIGITDKGKAWARGGHNRNPFPTSDSSDLQAIKCEMLTWDLLDRLSKEVKFEKGLKKEKYKNGVKVAVSGFMTPLQTDDAEKKATSFLLTRNQSGYCYGTILMANEWVYVNMASGKTAEIVTDVPVTVEGTLDLVENKEKNGSCLVYRVISEKVVISR